MAVIDTEIKPPVLVVGPLAWLRKNLFSTWYNVLITLLAAWLLYVVLKSIRTALVIGTMSTLVTMPIAVGLGITAGYLRGWIDEVIQYVYTVINSIPYVLLIASAVLILVVFIDNHPEFFQTSAERTDARLFFLCVILGMTSWTDLCRLIRGEVIKLREAEYIQAAQAFGRMCAFHGQMGMYVRALTYMLSHGSDGLAQVAVGLGPAKSAAHRQL